MKPYQVVEVLVVLVLHLDDVADDLAAAVVLGRPPRQRHARLGHPVRVQPLGRARLVLHHARRDGHRRLGRLARPGLVAGDHPARSKQIKVNKDKKQTIEQQQT